MLGVSIQDVLPLKRSGGQQGRALSLEGPTLTPSTMVPSAPGCYAPATQSLWLLPPAR